MVRLRRLKGTRGEPPTNCDECDAPLTIPSDAIHGEIVSCKECGASYEIRKDEASGLITLKPADKEQEDWGE
ncbi:MAG: alpha-aminoadipate/glutamate carrier protein LysW/ArgW [Thaumarchaeota archaeon]|nr:alpha-aminoadipate/glutamate carrier protein LysW/ArgW [Nitrososphaerota archaeon]